MRGGVSGAMATIDSDEELTHETCHPTPIEQASNHVHPSGDSLDAAEDYEEEDQDEDEELDDCMRVDGHLRKHRFVHIEEYQPAAEGDVYEHTEKLTKRPGSTGKQLFTIKERTFTKVNSLVTQGKAASMPSLIPEHGPGPRGKHSQSSNIKTRPAWDDSWSDDWFKHHSQRSYIDPLHNQPHYSVMHYRQGSPDTKILLRAPRPTTSERISCQSAAAGNTNAVPVTSEKLSSPKLSSRESIGSCATHAPDSQDSPLHSSHCSNDSSFTKSSHFVAGTAPSSPCSSRGSVTSGSGFNESVRYSGKHGFRIGLHGSTGKPWQTAPFSNDREHPFLGHYFDRNGLESASRRGRRPLSDFSVIPPDIHCRTSKLVLARRRRDTQSSSSHAVGSDDSKTYT